MDQISSTDNCPGRKASHDEFGKALTCKISNVQSTELDSLPIYGRQKDTWKNGHSPSMAISKMSVLGLPLLQGRNTANLRKLPEIHNSKIIVNFEQQVLSPVSVSLANSLNRQLHSRLVLYAIHK